MEYQSNYVGSGRSVGSYSPNGGVSVLREAYPADSLPFGVFTTAKAIGISRVSLDVEKRISKADSEDYDKWGKRGSL